MRIVKVHDANLLLSVRACFHIHLMSKTPAIKTAAKAALTQIVSIINQRMELNDSQHHPCSEVSSRIEPPIPVPVVEESAAEVVILAQAADEVGVPTNTASEGKDGRDDGDEDVEPGAGLPAPESSSSADFSSVFHRDAYLLFRALCKLSMKGFTEESQVAYSDNIVLQNKILSLELIHHLLKNCGSAFRAGDKFIYAIRNFLCVSLLNNCTSHVAQVTGLSLQIFILLMQTFKEHLKSEVEVFVSTIFLRILESENSTYEHKVRVLEVFHTICKDPTAQIEIFINYDCDLDAINLFTRIVSAFAKIAKNPWVTGNNRAAVEFMSNSNKRFQAEDLQIRSMGLEGLVLVLRSLVLAAGFNASANNAFGSNSSSKFPDEGDEREISEHSQQPTQLSPLPQAADEAAVPDTLRGNLTALSRQSVDNIIPDNANANMVGVFDKKLKIQEEIDTGIVKFNLSPMKGIKYLVSLGHLRMDPKIIAKFLQDHEEKLDKTSVGDLLGREKDYENGFCYKVLHEYVQAMDFSAMAFDAAMRHFLGGFRLPGEAQKIDRIMEKFAERYYIQHRDEFASADMAFILAFSTIMLQTNLHNPAIKDDKRMTKDQFIKQNKGISSDGELSDELLSNIYDRIAAQPFSITADNKKIAKKEEPSSNFVMFHSIIDRKKKDAFSHERKEMVRAGEAMIRQMKKRSSVFLKNVSLKDEVYSYIKAMYEIVWPPMLAVLSQILETYDDPTLVKQCLQGFQLSILLSCRMEFTVARNTFVNALAKFTTLDSVREMKQKNVQCIKLLLTTALSEGEFLEESWIQILQNISHLARLLLFGTGLHTDDVFFSDSASNTSEHGKPQSFMRRASSVRHTDSRTNAMTSNQSSSILSDPFTKLFMGPSKAETTRLMEEANSELLCQDIDSSLVDRIFTSSTALSGSSILHFVSSLCDVSMAEISTSSSMNSLRGKESAGADTSSPRVFSLQKLVEVADCNMNIRARMDWAKIWSLLANHFSIVGVSDNQALAMFAIDSLKQLSIKFLQKDELSNFNFQRIFLKPFEKIMVRCRSVETKDLILRCLHIMIKSCASNIHSGWRSIFSIFDVAAAQENLEIAKLAFDITEQLMNEQFDLLIFDFVELMNCLVAFASSPHTSLSLRALSYLAHCADHLANGEVTIALENRHMSSAEVLALTREHRNNVSSNNGQTVAVLRSAQQINGDDSVFRLWWPLLLGLSTRVGDARLQVRMKALDCLQSILRKHGALFSPQAWSVIFKGVLFPMVDSAKTDNTLQPRSTWPSDATAPSQDKHSWIGTMALSVLSACVELYLQFKQDGQRTRGLLGDLLGMLCDCILQDTESLSRMGARVLRDLTTALACPARRTSSSFSSEQPDVLWLLEADQVDLLIKKVSSALLGNLLLDFQQTGAISVQACAPCPVAIKILLTDCPLSRRRRERGQYVGRSALALLAAANIGRVVSTPFGLGTVMEVRNTDELVEERVHVQLTWGAHLYTSRDFKVPGFDDQQLSRTALVPEIVTAGEDRAWRDFAPAAMTCLAVTLELLQLNRLLVARYVASLQLVHVERILRTIECCYWHAYCFNENPSLRLRLQQKGFMNRNSGNNRLLKTLPNLLEQEVLALESLLQTAFDLYDVDHATTCTAQTDAAGVKLSVGLHSKEEALAFSRPWLQRYVQSSCMHCDCIYRLCCVGSAAWR